MQRHLILLLANVPHRVSFIMPQDLAVPGLGARQAKNRAGLLLFVGTMLLACTIGVGRLAVCLKAEKKRDAQEAAESNTFFDPALESETKRRGEVIAAAIERFHADRGVWPASLQELVPVYMAEISLPVAGRAKWYYHIDPVKNTYTIAFGIGDGCYPCSWFPSGDPDIAGWYDDS